MNKIYVSFSPYIAKVLREEMATAPDAPIQIPPHISCEKFWQKRFPLMPARQLRKQPGLLELFTKALRDGTKDPFPYTPYNLAYSEDEYNSFPDSPEKRDELVAFALPKVISYKEKTYVTNTKNLMERRAGNNFRQAAIYHFYEIFGHYLHSVQLDCIRDCKPFSPIEAIQLFADEYDLTSNEFQALRTQYYRRPH